MPNPTDIYGGVNPTDLPLYTLATAARIVQIRQPTLRTWVLGRDYPVTEGTRRFHPLIKPADKKRRRLSFKNLVELHVLSLLRGRKIQVERIRKASRFISKEIGTEHPLADANTQVDETDVYVEYLDMLINASGGGQRVLREVVERHLDRIDRDEGGLARRLFPIARSGSDPGPTIIVIDPTRRFGKPMIAGSGVETRVLVDRFNAGDATEALAGDFGLKVEQVEEAVRFESLLRAS